MAALDGGCVASANEHAELLVSDSQMRRYIVYYCSSKFISVQFTAKVPRAVPAFDAAQQAQP